MRNIGLAVMLVMGCGDPFDGKLPTGEGGGGGGGSASVCGDGEQQDGEACDDGNTDDGDGCSSTCQLPSCGDAILDPGELCFSAPTELGSGGVQASALAIGDCDDDGDVDIVVGHGGDGRLRVFRNNAGVIESHVTFTSSVLISAIALGDVQGGTPIDLIVGGTATPTLFLREGNGDCSFSGATSVDLGATFVANSIAVGQLDGTGRSAAVVALTGGSSGSVAIVPGGSTTAQVLGAGAGAFTAQPSSIALGDLTGDAQIDAVYLSQQLQVLAVMAGDGTTVQPPTMETLAVTGAFEQVLADIDNDNDNDVIVTNAAEDRVVVVRNEGGALSAGEIIVVSDEPSSPRQLAVGDVNNDGILDLVVVDASQPRVIVLLGDGSSDGTGFTVTPAAIVPVPKPPTAIAVTDLNGDGAADIVTVGHDGPTEANSTVTVLLALPEG